MNWLEEIMNYPELELSTLQFANKERLKYNKNFCIFDEVGTGKTISAGIMILEALCNRNIFEPLVNKNILIITTELGKVSFCYDYGIDENGNILNDNKESKLPFREVLNDDKSINISIINNYFGNIQKENNKKWGMVIIDEAHLFLSKTNRRDALEKLCSEKVIVLTATPIVNSDKDFDEYEKIVKEITKHNRNDISRYDWNDVFRYDGKVQGLKDIIKNSKNLICSDFNITSCVTRYFKETMQCFINNKHEKNNSPKRTIPEVLPFKSTTKDEDLLGFIESKLNENEVNRFVIFVMTVGSEERPLEARKLEKMFNSSGYNEYVPKRNIDLLMEKPQIRSYFRITGDVNERKEYIRRLKNGENDNIPTILILTYQIGQQAINLPGYNNIINYYISATPSSLEQRYGRIDRRGKAWEIKAYNMLGNSSCGLNNINFSSAVYSFINIINFLPSKNCILTKENIRYLKTRELKEYYETLMEEYEKQIKYIYKLFINNIVPSNNNLLYEYCVDNELYIDGDTEIDFCTSVKVHIERKMQNLNNKEEKVSQIELQINELEDKVLYFNDGLLLAKDTIHMAEDIKSKIRDFSETFEKECKIPIALNRKRMEIEECFEKYLLNNEMEEFLLKNRGLVTTDMNLVLGEDYELVEEEYLWKFINELPVMKLRRKVTEIIKQSLIYTYDGYMRKNKLDCMYWGKNVDTIQYVGMQLYNRSKEIDISDDLRRMLFEEYEIDERSYSFKYNNNSGNSIVGRLFKSCIIDKGQFALVPGHINEKLQEKEFLIRKIKNVLYIFHELVKEPVPKIDFEELVKEYCLQMKQKTLFEFINDPLYFLYIIFSMFEYKTDNIQLNNYREKLYEWFKEYVEESDDISKMSYADKYAMKMPENYFEYTLGELDKEFQSLILYYNNYRAATHNMNARSNTKWYNVTKLYDETIRGLKVELNKLEKKKNMKSDYYNYWALHEYDDDEIDEYESLQEKVGEINFEELSSEIEKLEIKLKGLIEDKSQIKGVLDIKQYLINIMNQPGIPEYN